MFLHPSTSQETGLAGAPQPLASHRFTAETGQGADRRPGEPVRILVVEDDFLISMSVEDALIHEGFEVVGVTRTAEEAIDQAGTIRPNFAIMDIRLAGVRDGVDAAIEIYRRYGIRCIFATAHADAEIQARALAASPLGWLQKPYSMHALVELARQAARSVQDQ